MTHSPMRRLPLALLLAGLPCLAHASDVAPAPAATDAAQALKAAMGGPALDAITRFDYRLTRNAANGDMLHDGRYILLPAQRVLQVDDAGGARVWSEPALTWRLREGHWETLDDTAASRYRGHVATHFVSLLRDPRTQVAAKASHHLRLTPADADAFDAILDPASGRIVENRFDDGIVAVESQYAQVSGLWWPMRYEVRSDVGVLGTGQFRDVAVHTTADAALPAMPVATAPRTVRHPPPGVARLVGAGWLSGAANDYNVNTDAAGTRLVFARSQPDFKDARIFTARREGDGWQAPQPVPFSDPRYSDSDPWLTPDGTMLYFVSNRPLQGEAPRKDLEVWRVAVHAEGFGTPQHLATLGSDGQELGPELHDGWLYFNSTRKGGPARMAIWRARVQGDGFGAPEPLGAPFNDGVVQGDFTLSPDGDTALFWSVRGESKEPDLFAARRTAQGWSPAVRLPAPINAPGMDFTPAFSADGHTLTFASERRPSWLADATHAFNGQANAWIVDAALITRALDAPPVR